jgi:hypothetical protein
MTGSDNRLGTRGRLPIGLIGCGLAVTLAFIVTHARASDTSSDLQQQCIQEALAMPQVVGTPTMYHAGIRLATPQRLPAQYVRGALDAGCAPAAASSQQQCVNETVARPQIQHTQMKHAGVPGVQEMYARVINKEVPGDCGEVLRVERFMFKVQDSVHRAHWISLQPGLFTFRVGNDAGTATVYLTVGSQGRGLYKCSKGPKTTGAKVDIKVIAMDTQTNEALAKRLYKAPIRQIFPRRC